MASTSPFQIVGFNLRDETLIVHNILLKISPLTGAWIYKNNLSINNNANTRRNHCFFLCTLRSRSYYLTGLKMLCSSVIVMIIQFRVGKSQSLAQT
jgi:hypothetical protein